MRHVNDRKEAIVARRFIFAAIAALALITVPLAAGSVPQQGNVTAKTVSSTAPARGAQAVISAPSVVPSSDGWTLNNVRLVRESDFPVPGMVQIGWFKTGSSYAGTLDGGCGGTLSSGAQEGYLIETKDALGDYRCTFTNTPPGVTWGTPVLMTIKYVGQSFGDPGIDGDFTVTFGNGTPVAFNDLGWSPVAYESYANVGNEWFNDSGTSPPAVTRTAYSNLKYQDWNGGVNGAFITASALDAGGVPVEFDHQETVTSTTNSGCITYPSGALPAADPYAADSSLREQAAMVATDASVCSTTNVTSAKFRLRDNGMRAAWGMGAGFLRIKGLNGGFIQAGLAISPTSTGDGSSRAVGFPVDNCIVGTTAVRGFFLEYKTSTGSITCLYSSLTKNNYVKDHSIEIAYNASTSKWDVKKDGSLWTSITLDFSSGMAGPALVVYNDGNYMHVPCDPFFYYGAHTYGGPGTNNPVDSFFIKTTTNSTYAQVAHAYGASYNVPIVAGRTWTEWFADDGPLSGNEASIYSRLAGTC